MKYNKEQGEAAVSNVFIAWTSSTVMCFRLSVTADIFIMAITNLSS